uniref:Uridine kinase n=1 Tax=Oryza barthii TaxID=65489 RepID=A0A0D3F3H2_9ORYZ
MGSRPVDEVLDAAAAGVHYSTLRLDELNINGSMTGEEQPTTSGVENGHQEPFVIGVAGGASSGKSTVCKMIIDQLRDQRVVVVTQESFYYGLSDEELVHVHDYNFDHPDAFDTELLLSCMENLKHGKAVDIPNYNFKTYKSVASARKVNPSDVIILEGILVFHDSRVRDLMNMKIFVDTDADVRLTRRIRRDTIEKGRDIKTVLDQYSKFVKPAFEDFILPTKKYADIIIPRGGDNDVAIDLIVQHIRTKLGQHDLCKVHPNLYVIQTTYQVVEHGLGHLPFKEKQVITPTGSVYTGVEFSKRLCGISVIRSGESMENALRACCKGIKIGKILIHREGDNGKQLIYHNLPKDIANRHVLLLDPILGTGNSAVQAISLLLKKGVQETNIIFLNLISAPQGVHVVSKRFPRVKIVTSEIEFGLNDDFRVIPGMGEFGDRYFGTDDYQSSTPFFCDEKNRVSPHPHGGSSSERRRSRSGARVLEMAGAAVSASSGAMNSVIAKLASLLTDEYTHLKGVKSGIRWLRDELGSMNAVLQRLGDMDDDQIDVQTKEWRNKVRELSYDIEDCIDRFLQNHSSGDANANLLQKGVRKMKKLWENHQIGDEIKQLKERVIEEKERHKRYKIADRLMAAPQHVRLDPRVPALYEQAKNLVGIDKPREQIIGWIKSEEKQLKVVFIFGTGGLGKTTLAMEVYHKIDESFDCRAMVSVSRTPDIKKLLRDILFQINEREYEKLNDWEMEQLIRND